METINAFIGHSFDDNDKIVVSKFLEIFNTIKEGNTPFNWDHAEKAEVNILSNKVLEKMKNANTFIGICTQKERVIKNKLLKKCFLKKENYLLKNDDYEWKTSDWIIQEIGCAFGREMKIILLLESDLRIPGGLQGDLEYISFDRNNPEKVFKKILEMINNLLPKVDNELIISKSQKDKPEVQKEVVLSHDSKEKYQIEIKPEWGKDDYDKGLIDSILFNEREKEKEIIEMFNKTYAKDNKEEMLMFKAKSLYYNFIFKNENNLEEMKQILSEYPKNYELNNWIAIIYNNCEQYEYAFNHSYYAYQYCKDIKKRIQYLSSAAIYYIKSGKIDCKKYLDEMIDLDNEGIFKENIYETMATTSKIQKNDYLYFLILEAAVNEFPLNEKFRFDLSYRYSETNNSELSYFHYLYMTKHFEKSTSSWNNFGVAAHHLNLPNKAVNAYRRAEELGETLSMSNLAKRFITEGFFNEAEAICKKALEIKGYHTDVPKALSLMETNKTIEDEKETKLLDEVKLKRSNILQITKGLLYKQIKEITRNYTHPDCLLEVIIDNDNIKFTGTYQKKQQNFLASLISQNANPDTSSYITYEYKVEIEGIIYRHIIEGKYSNNRLEIKEEDKIKNMNDIVMVVSEDMKLIEVYDKYKYEKLFDLIET